MKLKRLVLPGIVALVTIHSLSFWRYTVEDAYISFRYAHNLVRGLGLVYNVGDRVEGYSNFTWVLLAGASESCHLPIPQTMKALGLLLGIISVWLLGNGWSKPSEPWRGRLAVFWLAASSANALWLVAGLETPLFCALLAGAWICAESMDSSRRALATGLLFGLASLTRPEGPVYLALYLAGRLLYERSRKELRLAFWVALGCAALFIPFMAFRWQYFHDLLPNTFYVKSIRFQGSGWQYLQHAIPFTGVIPLLLAPFSLMKRSSGHAAGFGLTIAGVVLAVLRQGGDWMPMARFLTPVLPLVFYFGAQGLINVGSWTLAHGGSRLRPFVLAAAGFLVVAAGVIGAASARRDILRWEIKLHQDWEIIGRWLNQNAPPNAAMATGLGGILPYYAELTNFDNGGLTNREIARVIRQSPNLDEERRRVDTLILQLAPDYYLIPNIIQLWPQPMTDLALIKWDLLSNPEFLKSYRLQNVQLGDRYFAFFQRVGG